MEGVESSGSIGRDLIKTSVREGRERLWPDSGVFISDGKGRQFAVALITTL